MDDRFYPNALYYRKNIWQERSYQLPGLFWQFAGHYGGHQQFEYCVDRGDPFPGIISIPSGDKKVLQLF
jgi:hypothetical protein